MSWLARLSPVQAVRWALLWPALLVTVALGAAAFVAVAQARQLGLRLWHRVAGVAPGVARCDGDRVRRVDRPAGPLSRALEIRAPLRSARPLPNVRWNCRAV